MLQSQVHDSSQQYQKHISELESKVAYIFSALPSIGWVLLNHWVFAVAKLTVKLMSSTRQHRSILAPCVCCMTYILACAHLSQAWNGLGSVFFSSWPLATPFTCTRSAPVPTDCSTTHGVTTVSVFTIGVVSRRQLAAAAG